jgi:hypothetical protein
MGSSAVVELNLYDMIIWTINRILPMKGPDDEYRGKFLRCMSYYCKDEVIACASHNSQRSFRFIYKYWRLAVAQRAFFMKWDKMPNQTKNLMYIAVETCRVIEETNAIVKNIKEKS